MLDAQKSIQEKETTWIIDHGTGALTVEGLTERELLSVASDLLPEAAHVNCARPVNAPPVQMGSPATVGAEGPGALSQIDATNARRAGDLLG